MFMSSSFQPATAPQLCHCEEHKSALHQTGCGHSPSAVAGHTAGRYGACWASSPSSPSHLLTSLLLEPFLGCGSGNLWRRRNLWSLPVQQPLLNRPPSRAFFQGAEELPPEKSVATLEGSGSAADEAGSPRPVQAASFSLLKMEGLPVPLLCLPPPVEGHPVRQTGGRAGGDGGKGGVLKGRCYCCCFIPCCFQALSGSATEIKGICWIYYVCIIR